MRQTVETVLRNKDGTDELITWTPAPSCWKRWR
jgi:hypothetical protein